MEVENLMNRAVHKVGPDSDCAEAVRQMNSGDCGFIPVVDSVEKVVGVVTDRDICIAVTTENVAPSGLRVRDVMCREVHTCAPQDDARSALQTMSARKVRRLPVVDEAGRLRGIVSVDDLVRTARHQARDGSASFDDVMDALVRIYERNPALTG